MPSSSAQGRSAGADTRGVEQEVLPTAFEFRSLAGGEGRDGGPSYWLV